MRKALLSVSDKTGLVDLGKGLIARGFELVSTGGTARALREPGLTVTDASEVTHFPEMMDGRVKTLHPALLAGILARRDHPEDLETLAKHGISLIDVVVTNLYPFAKVAAKPGVAFDELIENIDIGGPTMIRAAAKNFHDVFVVVDPDRYHGLLEALDKPMDQTLRYRHHLMCAAFSHTYQYDGAIAGKMSQYTTHAGEFVEMADLE